MIRYVYDWRKTGALICALLLLYLPGFSVQDTQRSGHLMGFIIDEDNVSPVVGATVQVKNVSTGTVRESSPSDENGMFKIENLNPGIYSLGVQTLSGDFNLEELIGINESETTKVSFSLTPYTEEEAEAVEQVYNEIYREEKIAGEVAVGRVLSYNPVNATAEVFIFKGYIKLQDRIHARGDRTHFYQNVQDLILDGQPVDKAFAGRNVIMTMKYAVEKDDLIYLVCKKGVVPFFLTPLGYITALAATGLITYGIVKISEVPCPECSVYVPPKDSTKKK